MLSFFPRGVLNEVWDLIESVSEGFPTYSCKNERSVVDYILASTSLFNSFTDLKWDLKIVLRYIANSHLHVQNMEMLRIRVKKCLNETKLIRFNWKGSKKTEFLEYFHNLYSDFKG